MSEIGQGTFSRIFKSLTPCFASLVAIKVCNADFSILGLREACILRYFASKSSHGYKHFVGLLDTFRFDGHYCLVLELCKATLVDYIALPSNNRSTKTETGGKEGRRTKDNIARYAW